MIFAGGAKGRSGEKKHIKLNSFRLKSILPRMNSSAVSAFERRNSRINAGGIMFDRSVESKSGNTVTIMRQARLLRTSETWVPSPGLVEVRLGW